MRNGSVLDDLERIMAWYLVDRVQQDEAGRSELLADLDAWADDPRGRPSASSRSEPVSTRDVLG